MNFAKTTQSLLLACLLAATAQAQDPFTSTLQACDEAASFECARSLELAEQAVEMETDSFESNWRLCRSQIDAGEMEQDAGHEDVAEEAYALALASTQKLVQTFPGQSMAHYYRALALGRRAMFAGGKEKVQLSNELEKHALKALELDPLNARAHGLIGRYYREMAHLSWVMRTLAETLFGDLPEGGDELSLKHLKKATELKSDWIFAWVELAETHEVMNHEAAAKSALKHALSLKSADHRDPILLAQAKEMMDDLN
jgi:tetratricopeptide (TPR) repeat protein